MGPETAGLGTGSAEPADETKPSAIATSNERAREQRAANLPGRMGSSEWSVSGEQVSAANPMRTRERDMMGPPSPATPLASDPHPPSAPHTNLAAIAGPLDERRQHRTVNGAGTITWARPDNSRLTADQWWVRGGRDRVQTELHEGDRDAGVIRIPREVRPQGRDIAHFRRARLRLSAIGRAPLCACEIPPARDDGRTRAGLRMCPMPAHTLAVGSRTNLPSKTISRT